MSGTGVVLVGKPGRGSSGRSVACLGRCGSVLLRSWSVYLFHCISFRGGFRYLENRFRASSAACFVLVFVQPRAFLSALVHLVPLTRLVGRCGCRPVSRSVRLVGEAMRRRAVACLPVLVGSWGCCAGDAVHLVPSRFSPVRYGGGEAGRLVSPSCLVGVGGGVDVRRSVPIPVAVPCDCLLPCRSVRKRSDEMRRRWRRLTSSGVGVACLPCRLAPLFDKGDGEGGGTNDDGRLRICGAAGR